MSPIGQNAYRILAYGHDAVLLQTRCMVLRHAGFEVDAANSAKEFEACVAEAKVPYRLYVLGHTVPVAEQERIADSVSDTTTVVYKLAEIVTPPQQLIAEISTLLRATAS